MGQAVYMGSRGHRPYGEDRGGRVLPGCVSSHQEPDHLRLLAFEIYRALLAKVRRTVLVFPLKHQVFNLTVLLVLHLEDVNASVAQVRGPGACASVSSRRGR